MDRKERTEDGEGEEGKQGTRAWICFIRTSETERNQSKRLYR